MENKLFQELLASLSEGGAIMRGEQKASREFVVPDINVKEVRRSYGVSQERFSALLGVSVATLRNWEQGRRKPTGAAVVLLKIIAKHPEIVQNLQ